MANKSWSYAQLEGISQVAEEFGNDLVMTGNVTYEASFPGMPDVDLLDQLGARRILDYSAIDEKWYTAAALGSALVGTRAINWHGMYMANAYPFHLISQHAAKFHHMTGGQATVPAVFKISLSNQAPGMAGQHSDYEADSWYAHIPGVKTVIPSTVHDAKGLMITALRGNDPVVYLESGALRGQVGDAPEDAYEVPIGRAAVRQEGTDVTIVSSGVGMRDVTQAAARLEEAGVSVEVIDLVTLHPMDTETLVKSVQKTQRLLTFDQSKYTLAPGAEVVARVAEGVPGARFKRIAYPDAPPPGAPEMFNWMRPSADHVFDAAQVLLES